VSCAAANRPIPESIYLSPGGSESVAVENGQMRFQIRVPSREGIFDRTYDYEVAPDGTILNLPMTSLDALVMGRWDWYWDGQSILRRNRETKESVIFSRVAPKE
jgi:hypothetical protein